MQILKTVAISLFAFGTVITAGCAGSRTHEASGQYVDDSVITAKVKAAILGEASLKVAEINVETFKGEVQLSGFVSHASDIPTAVRVTRAVAGVSSVKNSLQVK